MIVLCASGAILFYKVWAAEGRLQAPRIYATVALLTFDNCFLSIPGQTKGCCSVERRDTLDAVKTGLF